MIDWQQFHFLRPEWLYALLPLALLLIVLQQLRKQQSGWQSVLASHLYRHLVTGGVKRGRRVQLGVLAFGWVLTVLALAGPTWEKLPQPVYQLNTGKVVVMDMSLSMRATDVKPDRLSRAKYKAIDLIDAIGEGETGLVAYAGDAFVISPLSSDVQNLTTLIPSLSPEIMPVPGSDPFTGLQTAIDLLNNAGFNKGEIFWITDGVSADQTDELRKLLDASPYRLSVLAVGSEEGAPIQLTDGELLKDARGAIVIPKLNTAQLSPLVQQTGGRLAPLQPDDSDIRYLTSQSLLDRSTDEQQQEDDNTGDSWKEMGPVLLLVLLPFAAYGFRRGVLPVVCVGMLFGVTQPAKADWWDDLWKTGNQQGMDTFNAQQFGSAAEQFDDPLWRGSSLYRAGEYEAALQAFEQVDNLQSLYNQGNALAQLGDIAEAIRRYDQVLEQDPEHQDARYNKQLLEQQQQQQQQQDQQQQDNQQQQDQQQDGQQSEQQQGNGENQQQNSDSGADQQSSQSDPQQSDAAAEQQQPQDPQDDAQQQETEASEQQTGQGEPQQAEAEQMQQQELSDEEKEQMQRMQNLLRKVPDDPSYLLKRKMQLEYQQRRRQRLPSQQQENW